MNEVRSLITNSANTTFTYEENSDKKMCRFGFYTKMLLWQKITFWACIALFIVIFLAFVIIWVIFPLVFMNQISIQRFFIFFNFNDPKNPDFNHPENYGYKGVANFYLTTKNSKDDELLSIGAWLLIPDSEINNTVIRAHNAETVSELLQNTKYPIVLYLHGVACNRIKPMETYKVLRKKFMLVAVDHRGYGDSGPNVPPSEEGIVNDTVQIYKWIRSHTKNDIYVWGHSLGGALAVHSVKRLKLENIIPMGLILESTFTTIREEIPATQIGKMFSWLLWFEATVLNPLEKNGFHFKSTTNILDVDCPIMHLHAQDDFVIPWTLGKKLIDVAINEREIPPQGNVTYHIFGKLGYGHTGLTSDSNIPKFIDEFIGLCRDQNKQKG
ncbi:lysophosphatidylserine lipase ABHD12-like isoform X1 [Diorhabda carinulata]|uniref:lysophosphatidylserine lipase ABHD12-like isoform X1 n=2 Tax=Diorhabda carinulata TaxID=1163345 RepID=UPI0025A1DF14|nr:lysophosphatidylserine lipase ABHD12-like isoform X1 [Diorhabda carinulata]